jgi:mRNA interferase MazF
VSLDPDLHPVPRVSAVNLDAVESVSVGALVERLDRLSDERITQVSLALAIAVACDV